MGIFSSKKGDDPNETRSDIPRGGNPNAEHASVGPLQVKLIKHDGKTSTRNFPNEAELISFMQQNSAIYKAWQVL